MRKKETTNFHITFTWLQFISKCIEPVNRLRFNDRPMEPSKSDPGLLQGQERALKLRLEQEVNRIYDGDGSGSGLQNGLSTFCSV